MPFYHALHEYRDQLRHVLCRHEQGAGHAAEGYARAIGEVGVCVATSGPGATNLVTPIADAWMDGTPLVAITGQVSSALIGTDAFQETDITGITLPITKHSYLVSDAREIPRVVSEAFHLARSGRPGPVLIDVTKDAQQQRATAEWAGDETSLPAPREDAPRPELGVLRRAAEMLARADRPLILAGNGVIQSGASAALRALSERTGIPVITTLHGKGAFPEHHALHLGMPGMHGWVHVNRAIQSCDVLLNVGSRFDDRVTGKASTFAPKATIIHIDIEPAQIGKTVRADLAIVADAKLAIEGLSELLPARERWRWVADIRRLQAMHQPRQAYRAPASPGVVAPRHVYAALDAAFRERGGVRLVTDVGQHQMWAAQLIERDQPRTHITSGGAGTMGFAIPAALGAAIACPHEQIWVIVGDGGFQMTCHELATIRQEGLTNIRIAIVNNGYLGMVRQWQELYNDRRYVATPLSGPCFARLAEAHGISAITVDRPEDVGDAVARAWDHDGTFLIDFRVEQDANVFPIVPAGNAIDEMLTAAPSPESHAEHARQ
jgi:acetolactate synthase-1/2/3 large subunit